MFKYITEEEFMYRRLKCSMYPRRTVVTSQFIPESGELFLHNAFFDGRPSTLYLIILLASNIDDNDLFIFNNEMYAIDNNMIYNIAHGETEIPADMIDFCVAQAYQLGLRMGKDIFDGKTNISREFFYK